MRNAVLKKLTQGPYLTVPFDSDELANLSWEWISPIAGQEKKWLYITLGFLKKIRLW